MPTHKGWFNSLIYATFIRTTNYRVCNLHIYLYLAQLVTLLPPERSLVPKLGLGITWVRQLRSGSCHYPSAATKCKRASKQTNPIGGKACSPSKDGLFCLYMQPLLVPQTTEFVICISIYIWHHALTPPGTLDWTRKV